LSYVNYTLGLLLVLQGFQIPAPPRGFGTSTADIVVDAAHAMSQPTIDRVNAIAFDVHAKSGGEITVVTLPDIGPREASDAALAIGRQWKVGAASKIGERTRNAGVVILIVPKESSSDGQGKCWIASGQGAEGFLFDSDAGQFCREAIPFFRRRDYGTAIELLALRVAQKFAKEFNFTLDTAFAPPAIPVQSQRSRGGGIPPGTVLLLFVIALVLFSNLGRRRGGCGCLPIFIPFGGGRGGWGGSGGGWSSGGGGGFSGGGGFGGFGGGGGFSGGGGGSNW
jgi:uncharacterized protein